ncbi:RNA polymerase sigma factor [Streptomyces xanthochromogenes]|uniref:RNA polymerase sigma factor n=1 Tax=Streptomyces xanthochromogenes TaxID=67384 RepID=UPI00381C4E3F
MAAQRTEPGDMPGSRVRVPTTSGRAPYKWGKEEDAGAFVELLTVAAARRIDDLDRAVELGQEAYQLLGEALAKGAFIVTNEEAYAFGILFHLIKAHLREQYHLSDEEVQDRAVFVDLGASVELEETLASIRKVLTPDQYACYVLHYLSDLAAPDIAAELGLSVAQVHGYLTRARAALRQPAIKELLDPQV